MHFERSLEPRRTVPWGRGGCGPYAFSLFIYVTCWERNAAGAGAAYKETRRISTGIYLYWMKDSASCAEMDSWAD